MSNSQQRWWFRRKEVGFGWGLPTCWQGWVTLAVYTVCLGLGLSSVGTRFGPHGHLVVGGVLTIALLVVVALKGEPLRGDRERLGESDDSVRRFDSYRISSYLIGSLFIVLSIPLALRWVPKNGSYGFRIPSTLTGTAAHWYHVNEVAGISGIVAGLVSIGVTTMIARRVNTSSSWRGPTMLLLTLALMLVASLPPLLAK
jgi:hypothetical protein